MWPWKTKKPLSLIDRVAAILPKPEPRWKASLREAIAYTADMGKFVADFSFGAQFAVKEKAWPWRDKEKFIDVFNAAATVSEMQRILIEEIDHARNDPACRKFAMEWNIAQREILAAVPKMPLSKIFSRYAKVAENAINWKKEIINNHHDWMKEHFKTSSSRKNKNRQEYNRAREIDDDLWRTLRKFQKIEMELDLLASRASHLSEDAQISLLSFARKKIEKAGLISPDYKP